MCKTACVSVRWQFSIVTTHSFARVSCGCAQKSSVLHLLALCKMRIVNYFLNQRKSCESYAIASLFKAMIIKIMTK